MDKQEARQVKVEAIAPNPANPRKRFDGRGFDELVASIREKGIIQPIVVRIKPANDEKAYEIVVGERRWKAAREVGLDTVPVIVTILTDEEAYEIMLIENLQREDLSPLEEAHGFKEYVKARGEDGIRDLAQKTGVAERYVRGRLAVLELPEKVVAAWAGGKLAFGHLEQLLRVKDDPGRLKESVRYAFQKERDGSLPSVHDLKEQIDRYCVDLSSAPFLDATCKGCLKNSQVQQSLFDSGAGDDGKALMCLDSKCFKSRLNEWLSKPENWEKSAYRKKFRTNGFRFNKSLGYNDYQSFYGSAPRKKCATCPKFVTIIRDNGDDYHGAACIGEKSCATEERRAAEAKLAGKNKKERKPGEARVPWHGEYFRDIFFRKRMPEIFAKMDADSDKAKMLKLVCIIKTNEEAQKAVAKAEGLKGIESFGRHFYEAEKVVKHVLTLHQEKIGQLTAAAIQAVIMEGNSRGWGGKFDLKERRMVAEYVGIDLGKEWVMTEEYVQKKTTAELMELGQSLKLFEEKKFKEYIARKFKRDDPKKLKKGQLVEAIMKSGIKLVGRVPKEITA